MDPVTALGVAAASVQFAAAAGKSLQVGIQLLRRLKETPGQLRELLDDVTKSIDRITQQQEAILGPAASLKHRLTQTQELDLREAAKDAADAMDDLKAVLDRLFPSQNGQTQSIARKIWTSLVSVKKEREIKGKLERIKRLNGSVTHQLQLISLNLHTQHIELSEQVLAVVKQGHTQTVSQLDGLKSLTEGVRQQTDETKLSINRLDYRVKELDPKLNKLGGSIQHTYSQVNMLSSQVALIQNNLSSEVTAVVQRESDATREDIRELQKAVMLAINGTQPGLSVSGDMVTGSLSSTSKIQLTGQTQQELTSGHSSFLIPGGNICATYSPPLLPLPCRCRTQRNRTVNGYDQLSLSYETIQSHEWTCPLSKSARYTWKYRLSVRLLPFVKKTVEVVLGGTAQGGGFQLTRPLLVVPTVKRSESYIFQLFDKFPGRWTYSNNNIPNPEVIRKELQRLRRSVCEAGQNGLGRITDRDEDGQTFLHAAISLTRCLRVVYHEVADEIDLLLQLAEDCGVDPEATTTFVLLDSLPPQIRRNYFHYGKYRTVGDAAREFVRLEHGELKQFSFLERLFRFCSNDRERNNIKYPVSSIFHPKFADTKCSALDMLRREPWISKYFFAGRLSQAILARNIDSLKQIADTVNIEEDAFGFMPVNALDLALGWPDGLRFLSTIWTCSIIPTIGLAAWKEDPESLEILLASPAPLFRDRGDVRAFVGAVISSDTRAILIQALNRRRKQLTELAIEYLSVEEQTRFGLLEQKTLDANANMVYNLLMDRSVPVPPGLYPGPPGSIYTLSAPIYTIDYDEFLLVTIFEGYYELFLAGFRDIDGGTTHDESPLKEIYSYSPEPYSSFNCVGISSLFLKMGASPRFHTSAGLSNLLFSIAKDAPWKLLKMEHHLSRLIEYAASLFSPLESDQCVCFCSSNGCLPVHFIVRRWNVPMGATKWIKICGLEGDENELYFEEALRAVLFDALGMVHTCCHSRYWVQGDGPLSDAEIREIQGEYSEMAVQLDLLMASYRGARESKSLPPTGSALSGKPIGGLGKECDVPDHRRWWRSKAEQILPDFSSGLMCGDDIQRMALQQRGYNGLDFADVIRKHFAGYICSEPKYPGDNGLRDLVASDIEKARNNFVPRPKPELLDEILISHYQHLEPNVPLWYRDETDEKPLKPFPGKTGISGHSSPRALEKSLRIIA
ncbi:hypothetical protein McanMca71_000843 [Microsporum canis]|uniref:Fungal N-terminal domain-containing protein n=1 Tax=Arthroderma otae (strain ATCC MYA-4605 / CBS 113480) TaxID=554155 RepID=C5FID0_ARTOC|nr:uncharacterized protein MCYG_01929 [Microsporum canis CBS 113480]EEQ29110.1 predicted protein [Microsporum canis CBS 113480]